MAEANLIPGATQVFADVLEGDGTVGGGDVKNLFKNMELGKYTLQDIVKVMEQLQKRLDQEALQKMLTRPTAELTELHTATQRFFEELNNQGATDLMRKFLDKLTEGVRYLTKNLPHIVSFIKDVWVVLKPMLTLWVTMWGVGKLLKFIGVLKSLRGGIKGLKGDSDSLATTMFMVGAALWRIGKFFKKSFIAIAILAAIDMLETLQGKRTVLTQFISDGGILGGVAAGLVAVFRTLQFVFESVMGVVDGVYKGITEGDWSFGFIRDSVDRLKESLSALFDMVMGEQNAFTKLTTDKDKGFLGWVAATGKMLLETLRLMVVFAAATGKLGFDLFNVKNSKDITAAIDEYLGVNKENWAAFSEADRSVGFSSGIMRATGAVPPVVSKPQTVYQQPQPVIFNPTVHINASGMTTVQAENLVNAVFDKQMTKAKANYVMAR